MTTELPPDRPLLSWDELFPEGRTVFYEGDDPEGFVRTMKEEFDFDPSEHPGWNEQYEWEGETHHVRKFFIPAGKMEAIYPSPRWMIGS